MKSRRNEARLKKETRRAVFLATCECKTTVDVSLVPRLFTPSFPSLLQVIRRWSRACEQG